MHFFRVPDPSPNLLHLLRCCCLLYTRALPNAMPCRLLLLPTKLAWLARPALEYLMQDSPAAQAGRPNELIQLRTYCLLLYCLYSLLVLILLASSGLLNPMMTLEAASVGALRVSHPAYLISACGMNGYCLVVSGLSSLRTYPSTWCWCVCCRW
jgi:hypothetical protein